MHTSHVRLRALLYSADTNKLLVGIIVLAAILGLGGAWVAYQNTNNVGGIPSADEQGGDMNGEPIIVWNFTEAAERDGIPYTEVAVRVNGTAYQAGAYAGSCSEIGATGGIDGTGLLAGELSAVQCYFAGGGNEIGVFAHEDGGYDILVGELDEGSAEVPPFRGNFKNIFVIE